MNFCVRDEQRISRLGKTGMISFWVWTLISEKRAVARNRVGSVERFRME
jgi:hypothetical protein